MTIKTGGPAFPALEHIGDQSTVQEGMTLRDYFAAKAMQSILSHAARQSEERTAAISYELADAMLKARSKQ